MRATAALLVGTSLLAVAVPATAQTQPEQTAQAVNPPATQVACAASTADAARDRLMKLLNTGEIFVFRYGTDTEGHTLTQVLVEGREVGQTLIAEGLAQPSTASTGAFCS